MGHLAAHGHLQVDVGLVAVGHTCQEVHAARANVCVIEIKYRRHKCLF
jgi:hypothetical protein